MIVSEFAAIAEIISGPQMIRDTLPAIARSMATIYLMFNVLKVGVVTGERRKGLKKIKMFPSPHVEIRISVSEKMEEDLRECTDALKKNPEKDNKPCKLCSWYEVKNEGVPCCAIKEVVKQVLGYE